MAQPHLADPGFEFRHSTDVQLRFGDIDMFGHVNNNVYLQLFDIAKYDYFRRVMGPEFDIRALSMVVVNINCDFLAPAFLDERLHVLTACASVGDKSLRLLQRVINADTGQIKCQATTVMATFDPATMTSGPVDPAARAALRAYEQRGL